VCDIKNTSSSGSKDVQMNIIKFQANTCNNSIEAITQLQLENPDTSSCETILKNQDISFHNTNTISNIPLINILTIVDLFVELQL
jgi:hypothetical protein